MKFSSAHCSLRYRRLLLAVLTLWHAEGYLRANPSGGVSVSGNVEIKTEGNRLTISQRDNRVILNWKDFSIAQNELTEFLQPGKNSAALNRVSGGNISRIDGTLKANGKVYLINPNGIVVGPTGVVNTAGFIASTLDVSNAEFLAGGDLTFRGNSTARVVNLGQIGASDEDVILIAQEVENHGTISAPNGMASLAAGHEVLVKATGAERVFVQAGKGKVTNTGLIESAAAELKAAGGNEYALAINNTGTVRATGVVNSGGRILLKANAGKARNAGTLTTRRVGTVATAQPKGEIKVLAPQVEIAATSVIEAPGGFVETSGSEFRLAPGSRVDTRANDGTFGTWLIDPTDFSIVAGSGSPTSNSIGADALAASLNTANVTILTDAAGSEAGNIYVNSAFTWSAATTLTLSAHNNIYVNAEITSLNSSGRLRLLYGQGNVAAGNASDYYVRAPINLQAGFNFTTVLGSDGTAVNYRVITSLGAEGSMTTTDLQGMNGNLGIRYALGANIDASITSTWNSGAGWSPIGDNSSNSNATCFTGLFDGLGHTITGLTVNRSTTSHAGSYVGLFGYAYLGSEIRNVSLKGGSFKGYFFVGSIAGRNYGAIRNSSASSSTNGQQFTGGLVGENDAYIFNSYATGSVTGKDYTGGLSGENDGAIYNSYATGVVSGASRVGGLSGQNTGIIDQTFSTGKVTGSGNFVNGLTTSTGTITNSYWATDTSGRNFGGGTGLTLAQLQAALPTGFDAATWGNADNHSTPYLKTMPLGQAYIDTDPGATNLYRIVQDVNQLQMVSSNLGERYALGNDIDASATVLWNGGAGFNPIGTFNTSSVFAGTFDGLGHVINDLTVDQSAPGAGLFGETQGATIRNVGLEGGSVSGLNYVGGLVGYVDSGTTITNTHASLPVSGGSYVGGLAGFNGGTIRLSYTTGTVSGSNSTGGFVGGMNAVGALIEQSYATGNVTGSNSGIGGFIGYNTSGSISQSYATGAVSGNSLVGGFAGVQNGGTTDESFSIGLVTGASATGGFMGSGFTGTTDSYWATDTSGRTNSPQGTGKTLAQLQQLATFANWDIDGNGGTATVWRIYEGSTTPLLRGFLQQVTATVDAGGSKTYDATTAAPGVGYTLSNPSAASAILGSAVYTLDDANAGTRTASLSGLYSLQQGYDIIAVGASYQVNQRAITITADSGQSKIYGNIDPTLTYSVGGLGLVNGDTLSGALSRAAGENVGNYAITQGSLSAGSNYSVTFTPNVDFEINQRAITITASAGQEKVYGNIDPTLTYTIGGQGLAFGDMLSGSLSRAAGENVGSYAINQGSLDAGANYSVTFTPGVNFGITQRAIAISVNAGQGKIYGDVDPTLTYTVGGQGLAFSDTLSGSLSRAVGEDVGNYAIDQGSLSASGNYTVTFNPGGDFGITPRSIVITPNAGQSKIFGKADPVLTYSVGGQGLAFSDTLGGGLARAAGEKAGHYAINQGTVSASANYLLTFTTGVSFTILGGASTIPESGNPNIPDHSPGSGVTISQPLFSMLDAQLALGGQETTTDLLRRLKTLKSTPQNRAFSYDGGRPPQRVLSYGSSFTVGQ